MIDGKIHFNTTTLIVLFSLNNAFKISITVFEGRKLQSNRMIDHTEIEIPRQT